MRSNPPHVRVPGVALAIALCLGPVSAIAQEEAPEALPAERVNYAAGHVWMVPDSVRPLSPSTGMRGEP